MNLDAGVKIPVSALNLFNTISILGLVPVIDSYLYPALRKRGYAVTMLDRIGWGFIFALLSMVLAALVEYYRLSEKAEPGDYYDKDARDNITPCRNLDDFNPYEYQKWEAGKGDVDEPENCHQISGCDLHYPNGAYEYLNLTCIKCDDIPQMSHLSVFWQVRLPSSRSVCLCHRHRLVDCRYRSSSSLASLRSSPPSPRSSSSTVKPPTP
jgi:hypothetical protein